MEIVQIGDSRGIESFARFAREVYRNNPLWIPPIYSEEKQFLAGKGLFFKHCRYRLFVAKEGPRIVARVGAYFDDNLARHWKQRIGLLGFFEALPDCPGPVQGLFEEAEKFLIQQGAEVIWAPFNGGIANSVGFLANAYNRPPVFLMAYNPPYYHQYLRKLGFSPIQELLAFTTDLLDPRLQRKVTYVLRRARASEVRIRSFDRRRFQAESFLLGRLYAETFKKHWGYGPQSEEEFFEIVKPFRLALDPDFILFAEHKGLPIGFVLSVPDYNPVIRELDGNLEFLNALSFLRLKQRIREARLIAIGVISEWRGKGVAPLLVASAYHAMIRKSYSTCEYSWVFRENESSQNVAKKFQGDPYKIYYVYGKELI